VLECNINFTAHTIAPSLQLEAPCCTDSEVVRDSGLFIEVGSWICL